MMTGITAANNNADDNNGVVAMVMVDMMEI